MPTSKSIEPILLDGGPAHGQSMAVSMGADEVVIDVTDGRCHRVRYLRTGRRSRVGRPIFEHQKGERRGASAR